MNNNKMRGGRYGSLPTAQGYSPVQTEGFMLLSPMMKEISRMDALRAQLGFGPSGDMSAYHGSGGGGGQAQQPVNFLPEGHGGSQIRNRMRGGMMGLNYRLRG